MNYLRLSLGFGFAFLLLVSIAPSGTAYTTNPSGTLTVSPGEIEYVYFSTPGIYDDTYLISLDWTISNFDGDEVYVYIETYPDGGMFANVYSQSSGSDDSYWSGDTDFRFAVRNDGGRTLYVNYEISSSLSTSDGGEDYFEEESEYLCCCSCCSGIILWVAPVAGVASIVAVSRRSRR